MKLYEKEIKEIECIEYLRETTFYNKEYDKFREYTQKLHSLVDYYILKLSGDLK